MIKTSSLRAETNFDSTAINLQMSGGSSAHDLSLSHAVLELSRKRSEHDTPLLSSTEHTITAQANICHPTTWYDVVPIITSGWAMSSVILSNGRQQILSFLLPGDIASTALVYTPTSSRLVQAITKVTYRSFNRSELKMALSKHPELLDKFVKVWIDERMEADQLIVDLGRRTAEERLARLILNLMKRLAKLGMVKDQTTDFPLRQHQIADAAGLTSVHVSRILMTFRRKGLIAIDGRSLTIRNPDELNRIATLK
jgi:CRP-like cAMP-binding protein